MKIIKLFTDRVMEAETIKKNATSLKSLRVGVNFRFFVAFAFFLSLGIGSAVAQEDNEATSDSGVEINGVIWATRNVDAPGTFADSTEASGMFYTWDEAQTVCPKGWRLPTSAEFQSLGKKMPLSSTKNIMDKYAKWIVENGVGGRLFGKEPNQLFLPAAGRVDSNGNINREGIYGCYWSSTSFGEVKSGKIGPITITQGGQSEHSDMFYALTFEKNNFTVVQYGFSKSTKFCVRCVADPEAKAE